MIRILNLLLLFTVGITGHFEYQLNLDKYHGHAEMTKFLKHFNSTGRNLTKLYSIGKSYRGNELWVLEVSAGETHTFRPNVKLIGNIHGNEPVGKELLLHFAKFLVKKYTEGDERVTRLLDFARIHILPSMNPDGFTTAVKQSVPGGPQSCTTGPGRKNDLDFDLNRNFPDHFRKNSQPTQKETLAVKRWLQDIPFVLSASLHGGSLVASYPYDNSKQTTWEAFFNTFNTSQLSQGEVLELWKKCRPDTGEPNPSPDDDVFQHLSKAYAQKHPRMHKGEPCPGTTKRFTSGITNGAAWYPLTGGMQDFNYVIHGCMELTLEISCCKFPNASTLPKYWEENRDALLGFVEEVRRGIRGVVVDEGGNGVANATIHVSGRDIPFHTTSKGEFWRILLPNVYYLHIEADGFESKKVPIKINDPDPTNWSQFINITLYRSGSRMDLVDQATWTNASLSADRSQNPLSSTELPSITENSSAEDLSEHNPGHLVDPLKRESEDNFSTRSLYSRWLFHLCFVVIICV